MRKNLEKEKLDLNVSQKRIIKLKSMKIISLESLMLFSLVVALSLLSFSLVKALAKTLNNQARIEKEREETDYLSEEVEKLKEKVSYYESDEYMEEMGRNRLSLSREGEKVVVLSESQEKELGEILSENNKALVKEEYPVWREWARFFLGNI